MKCQHSKRLYAHFHYAVTCLLYNAKLELLGAVFIQANTFDIGWQANIGSIGLDSTHAHYK